MKFAYIDESGHNGGSSDVFVMAGILIDAYKFRKWTAEFDTSIKTIMSLHPSSPLELKTSKLINGLGGWSKIDHEKRKDFISNTIDLATKIGSIYAFALSFKQFNSAAPNFNNLPKNQSNYWVASSMYISSLIQKKMQLLRNNKGLTVLIFDDNKQSMPNLSDKLYQCDDWYDDLYAKKGIVRKKEVWKVKPKDRFNQIVNTAFAIQSEHSSLVQVADVISYVYRRHLELCEAGVTENYLGERQLYQEWASRLDCKREKLGHTKPNSQTVKFYKDIGHSSWKV